jgi:hypothetical protein
MVDVRLTNGYYNLMEYGREIVLASAGGAKPIRVHPPGKWKIRNTKIAGLLKQKGFAQITIIDPAAGAKSGQLHSLAAALASKGLAKTRDHFVVWVARNARRRRADLGLIRPFADPQRIEIARNEDDVHALLRSLTAKLEVLAERKAASSSAQREAIAPRPSPLDQVRSIVAATKHLRGPSGNLSAPAVAQLFGVSVSKLAKWLHRSRQSLNKSPEADSLQQELSYFERIARLGAVLDDPNDFRKWLRMPNLELDGQTPMQLLDQGRWQVVADLVDDMLTGNPR